MALPLDLALLSAGVLGLRHGFDYDHIAAISDITSVQSSTRRAMRLGLLYALGHAATVAALGSAVIFFQLSLPRGVDRFAERLVGGTLVVLAIYVLGSLFSRKHSHIPPSRIALLICGWQWLHWKARSVIAQETLPRPERFRWDYDRKSVFLVGIIHGIGAETPSQLLLFLLAANLGGASKGFLGLMMFLVGLLAMNTLMTASAAGIFRMGKTMPSLMRVFTGLTAAYSFAVGILFLFGVSSILPPLGE